MTENKRLPRKLRETQLQPAAVSNRQELEESAEAAPRAPTQAATTSRSPLNNKQLDHLHALASWKGRRHRTAGPFWREGVASPYPVRKIGSGLQEEECCGVGATRHAPAFCRGSLGISQDTDAFGLPRLGNQPLQPRWLPAYGEPR